MITKERIALERISEEPAAPDTRPGPHLPVQERRIPQKLSRQPKASSGAPSLLWRLILFFVGLGLVMLGWPLAVSAVGAFIGVPLIIFGLALMQAQER
jgi:protein-S-isoprenylcysteine O-methyltransferase Ste14